MKLKPGRNRVPLTYVARDNEATITRPNANLLDGYVYRTLFTGRSLSSYASKLHSYIVRLIYKKSVADQKILPYKDSSGSRINFMSLKEYYEDIGDKPKYIFTAERKLQDIYYSGEKPPHMWWVSFEVSITNVFDVINKGARRQVHMDEMKLKLLNLKMKADYLVSMKINIDMQMNMVPKSMTYASTLVTYRNTVNNKKSGYSH